MPDRDRPDEAAALWFANGAILGYAALRVGSWLAGEPDPRMILASAHIGWYWRVTTALWWGTLGAAAGWRFGGAELGRRVLVGVVLLAVTQAILVP